MCKTPLPTIACVFRESVETPPPNLVEEEDEFNDPGLVYFGEVTGLYATTFADKHTEFARVKCRCYSDMDPLTGLWRVDLNQGSFTDEPYVPIDDCAVTVGRGSLGDNWLYILDYRHVTKKVTFSVQQCT